MGVALREPEWMWPAPPVLSSVPVNRAASGNGKVSPLPAPLELLAQQSGENTLTIKMTKTGMAEAQAAEGAQVRQQAQADTSGKCS